MTTNETSFFRNEPQLLSFSDEVLPLLIDEKMKKRGPKTLRIWSAGCSTRRRTVYSGDHHAEKLRTVAGWNIEIIANDISEQVLQKARVGEYYRHHAAQCQAGDAGEILHQGGRRLPG